MLSVVRIQENFYWMRYKSGIRRSCSHFLSGINQKDSAVPAPWQGGRPTPPCQAIGYRILWVDVGGHHVLGFPGGSNGKNLPAVLAGDQGSVSGSGISPGEGIAKSLQCSCLENPVDRGAWWATVHEVANVGHDSCFETSRTMALAFPFTHKRDKGNLIIGMPESKWVH